MAGASASVFVESKVIQRPVVLFSKSYCPDSKRMKNMFKDEYALNHKQLEVVNIERRQDVNQIEDYFMLACLSERRELPQLWVDGKYVGNEFVVMNLHNEGELSKILRDAGLDVPLLNAPTSKPDESGTKTEVGSESLIAAEKGAILQVEIAILEQMGSI